MNREKVVDWVQKLMAKAMDPNISEEEKDVFQEKVAQLMAKYKVSEMEATTPEEIKDHEMLTEEIKFYQGKGRMTWGYYLAWGIAPVFDCKAVKENSSSSKMFFFGFPEDVGTVAFFFRYFQLQIIQFADKSGLGTVKEKNSYAHGMSSKIVKRVTEAYKRAKEIIPSNCRDLIVIKEGAVEKYVDKEIGKTIPSRIRPSIDAHAWGKGYKDGDRVDIVNSNINKLRN